MKADLYSVTYINWDIDMKKRILRILLLIGGMNLFTSCYGMPPGEWEPELPVENPVEEVIPPAPAADELAADAAVPAEEMAEI